MVEMRPEQVKKYLTYEDYEILMNDLVEDLIEQYVPEQFVGVYGVPRGGLPMAVHLSHQLNLPLLDKPEDGMIIVDDIADSGKTFSDLVSKYRACLTCSLYYKEKSNYIPTLTYIKAEEKDWIVFPWEKR